MSQNLVFTNDVALALDAILDAKPHNHLAVIVDENTARVVLPEIRGRRCGGGRKNWHQLRWTEKRDWVFPKGVGCDYFHSFPRHIADYGTEIGLRRNAEARYAQQPR